MNKSFIPVICLLTLVILFAGVFIGTLINNDKEQNLGNLPGNAQVIASSSATYLGTNAGTRTATVTVLTINQVDQAQSISLGVQIVATTTTGTIYAQVETSDDASTWYLFNPPVADALTSTANITFSANGTGILTFTPTSATSLNPFIKLGGVDANYLRVRIWSTGTSTVLIEGFKNVTN